MAEIFETPSRFTLEHRPAGSASAAVALRLLLVLSFVVGGPAMAIWALRAPTTRVFECSRASSTCTVTPIMTNGDTRSLPMSQLRDVGISSRGPRSAVMTAIDRGRQQQWTGLVHGAHHLEALRVGVERLRAFPDGNDATLRVEVPNGQQGPAPYAFVIVFLFGVYILVISNRTLWRVSLVADRDAGTVTVRSRPVVWFTTTRTVPLASVRAVATVNAVKVPAGSRTRYSTVALLTDGASVPVHREYMTSASMANAREISERLARFLGVGTQGT